VVHFTYWELALEQLLLFGAATFWLFALTAYAFPSRKTGGLLGRVQIWDAAAGLAVAVTTLWIAGLMQGYTWVGSVESQIPNAGDGFRNSVAPLEGLLLVRIAGLAILCIAVLAGLVSLAAAARRSEPEPVGAEAEVGQPIRLLWQGALALILTAGLAVFVLPAVEADEDPTPLAESSRMLPEDSLAHEGREVYIQEGCWHCHSQQVRAIVTDVGLGPVSQPGDYAFDTVDLLGHVRIGPDLAHAAGRAGTDTEAWVKDHLIDPRLSRPWSTMPSYDHLSDEDLDALAAYVASLE
jgi:hypothetical protein